MLLFSCCFQIFFLSLVFHILTIMHPGVVFFTFILLGIPWISEFINLCLSPDWGNFQFLFLQIFFSAPFFLSSSSETSKTWLWDLWILSYNFWRFCSFFSIFFSLSSSDWIISIAIPLHPLILFFCSLHYAISSESKAFHYLRKKLQIGKREKGRLETQLY